MYNARKLYSEIDYKIPNGVYFDYINNLGYKRDNLLQLTL